MTRILKWPTIGALALLPLLMSSCSDDDEVKVDNEEPEVVNYSIVGEWLENSSTENMITMGVTNYKEDGTALQWTAIISSTIYLNETYDVTYDLNGVNLTEKFRNPIDGINVTDKYDILYLDKYTMITSYPASGSVSNRSKIIDTFTMIPDESRSINIDDSDFICYDYESSDERIATVDASGNINAIKRGTAYITAKSTIGDAVIRVVVEDDENLVENFLRWMGKDIYEVSDYYGKIYKDVPGDLLIERQYNVLDDYLEHIAFDYVSRQVLIIYLTFRNDIDWNIIADFFDGKYENQSIAKTLRVYIVDYEGATYYMMLDLNDGMMVIMPYTEPEQPDSSAVGEDSDYTGFDLLIGQPAPVIAELFGYELTEENMEDGFFDITLSNNNVFEEVSILFDESEEPYLVNTIMLRAKSKIEQVNIEPWYQKNFVSTGDELNPYSNEAGTVFVTFKKNGSRTYVYYRDRKVRK